MTNAHDIREHLPIYSCIRYVYLTGKFQGRSFRINSKRYVINYVSQLNAAGAAPSVLRHGERWACIQKAKLRKKNEKLAILWWIFFDEWGFCNVCGTLGEFVCCEAVKRCFTSLNRGLSGVLRG